VPIIDYMHACMYSSGEAGLCLQQAKLGNTSNKRGVGYVCNRLSRGMIPTGEGGGVCLQQVRWGYVCFR
jgi:hypothetical protein